MNLFSIELRTRLWKISLATAIVLFTWLLQTTVLTHLTLTGLLCNLPLTFTIIWAAVFGSRLAPLIADDLRQLSMGEIIAYQALSGSISGALIGALFAALYGSVLPIYPISYPLIGWITGYFSLKRINHAVFIVVPLVLFGSVLAESIMAVQLTMAGRPDVIPRFSQAILLESIMNALIAPSIFIPMRRWYEFWSTRQAAEVQ